MGIFLAGFLLVFFLLHYFVVSSYFGYFSFEKENLFYSVVFLLTISYPLAMLFEKKFDSDASRYFYFLCATWIGFMFISIFVILFFKLFDLFFEASKLHLGLSVFGFSMGISIYALINALFIDVKNIEISLEGIKKKTRIVQLSDIHLGSLNKGKYLERIVKKTNEQRGDVVVITGDLVDGSAPINEHMVDAINKIKADTFYVIGNHEIYEGLENILPVFKKTKMKILRDQSAIWKNLRFIGIDYREGNKFLNSAIKNYKLDKKKVNILLYHAPSLRVDNLAKSNISLHLSGHTHQGQIFPFNLLVRLAFPYVKGLHKSNNEKAYAYVSAGTGTWGPPMRLGSRCEITVIDLLRK